MYRGNVIFDECAFLDEEMMNVYAAFAIVDKNFATGKENDGRSIDAIRLRAIPKQLPNQLFYISSASDVSTEFYRLYRYFSKRMLMGDKDYFVVQLDCEAAFKPTKRGEVIAPLLSRETVEMAMKTNPEKARREYYCQFTRDAGNNAIVRRGTITRNEETRVPLLYNDTGDKKFIISYDPARSRDNSIILVIEVYKVKTGNKEDIRGRIVNCIKLVDVGKKNRTPMRTPEQIEYLKETIVKYNGGADAYGNILGIYIDAGSGGGGVNIADYLMADWVDKTGQSHRGLIDKEYSADYVKRFPNAVLNKLHLMNPSAYKSEMFEAMIELIEQDKVSFTAPYDNKQYLITFDVDETLLTQEKDKIKNKLKSKNLSPEEYDKAFQEELSKVQNVRTRTIQLGWDDELALANIDALKEELVNMVRTKRDSGRDSFNLIPEKANKLHDDRAYCCAMGCYGLMQERRKSIIKKPAPKKTELIDKLPIRKAKELSQF